MTPFCTFCKLISAFRDEITRLFIKKRIFLRLVEQNRKKKHHFFTFPFELWKFDIPTGIILVRVEGSTRWLPSLSNQSTTVPSGTETVPSGDVPKFPCRVMFLGVRLWVLKCVHRLMFYDRLCAHGRQNGSSRRHILWGEVKDETSFRNSPTSFQSSC